MKSERPGLPDLALLVVTVIWGSTFVLIKEGLDGIGPFAFVGLRFSIAAIVVVVLFRRSLARARRADWRAAIIAAFWLFIGYAFQTVGLTDTTASKAGFITGLAVILVPFVVWIWYRLAPGWLYAGGALTATAGLALLSLRGDLTPSGGDLLMIGCAIAFAVHIAVLGHFARLTDPGVLIAGQVAIVGIGALLAALLFEGRFIPATGSAWFGVIYTAFGATVAVLLLQTWSQQRVSPTRAAVIFTAEPIFAALFAWWIAGETLNDRELAGGALVIAGMLIALRAEGKRVKSEE